MKHQKVLVTVLLVANIILLADMYPRYNKAGYATKAPKRCILMSDESMDQQKWSIRNKDGEEVLSGVLANSIAGKTAHTPKPFQYEIEFSKLRQVGKYKIKVGAYPEFQIEIKQAPYDFAVREIVSFLKKQRSGVAVPPANEIGHPGDVRCSVYKRVESANDKWKETSVPMYVDMMGGWYDAGDYLKFTLTTAYTTYFLLRAYEEYPAGETSKTDKALLLEEAVWGMDFLMKTMPDENTFIIQVGNADDHKQGDRMPYNDQLNGQRHAYSAISPTQMGLTSAALALGARLLSAQTALKAKPEPYRTKAQQIYRRAQRNPEPVAWFAEGWEKFYADNNANDNMLLAATELYLINKEEKYLEEAREWAMKAGAGYWSSWANLNLMAHARLYPHAPEQTEMYIKQDLQNFQNIAQSPGNVWRMPHTYTWATLYSFFGVANGALLYAAASTDTGFDAMPADVLDYTLGMNNWGAPMLITRQIPGSVKKIYSQMYKLFPSELDATGAIAEGPGDRKTHDELAKYFKIPVNNKFEEFNTDQVVFYDHESDFQCMETTIAGLADGILFFTLINKKYR
ncbi:MAG: glycoside hydrolase family 9 protein [Cytophagaceae bacterium]|jgi:hypothetical protein|nr:glycoside hydrolase family 9 protein [Cytophagaceae bacterium]